VSRLVSTVSRTCLAAAIFLLVQAILRWSPVCAEPLWDVRALPLFAPAVALAALAALSGDHRRRRWPLRAMTFALGASTLVLAIAMPLRGGGLRAVVRAPGHVDRLLGPSSIDVTGRDLRGLAPSHRRLLEWDGALHAPRSGLYRLWVQGTGRVAMDVDGRPVVAARGEDAFAAGGDALLGLGPHRIRVVYQQTGPSLRLRLGWTLPKKDGSAGDRSDVVSPRYLGDIRSPAAWAATDLASVATALLVAALVLAVPWDLQRTLRLPAPTTPRQIAASLAGYLILAAALSWPLVTDLRHIGPVDRVDGRLNAWILAWDAHALVHQPSSVFEAPIFHPLPDALTFTENLLLPAALALPFTLAAGPLLAYNLLFFASAILSGLGTELLVRRVTGDRLASFVAGTAFAIGGHRWVRMAHLHVELTWLLPFALLALDRFWEKRSVRRALVVGLVLALQGWSSVYVGAMAATVLAVGVALMAPGLGLRGLARLAAGFALAAMLLAPVARPYLRMRAFQGMEFSLEEQALYATTPESYAAGSGRIYAALTQRHMDGRRAPDPLFPGLVLLVLGLAGLAAAPARYRFLAMTASLAAIVISLGPETAVYRFLYDHAVLFHGIRALGRFSLVPILALCVLAGLALAGRRRLLLWAALGAIVVESANVPARYGVYEPPTPAARSLAGGSGAVAYLPLGGNDTRAMLQATAHFRPLVNGDSGFVPRPYGRATELLSGSLSHEGLRLLRALDVRQVVVDADLLLPLVGRFGEERVYSVPTGDTARRQGQGQAVAVLWSAEGVVADLAEPRVVEGIEFEVDDRSWIALPRVSVSLDGREWHSVRASASLADAAVSLYHDPRHGRGTVRIEACQARFVRLDPELPVRPGALWVTPAPRS
jgi:PA14 domain